MLWSDNNWEIALKVSLWLDPFRNWARDIGKSVINQMQGMHVVLWDVVFEQLFNRLHSISAMLLSKYLFFSPLCQITSFTNLLNCHDILWLQFSMSLDIHVCLKISSYSKWKFLSKTGIYFKSHPLCRGQNHPAHHAHCFMPSVRTDAAPLKKMEWARLPSFLKMWEICNWVKGALAINLLSGSNNRFYG